MKLLKNLFKKPLFDSVDDIIVNEITIKDLPVMLEIYEVFEPYFKRHDFLNLLTEKTKELLVFIYICTGIDTSKLAIMKSSKLLPLFDKCLEVNHSFFTQTYTMKQIKEQAQKTEVPKQTTTDYQPSKGVSERIVSISKL